MYRGRTEEFLDLYKQLEEALEEKYHGEKRHSQSVVMEFIRDDESEPVRDKIDTCRELRNLLTHKANMGGEPIFVPSQPVVDSLRNALEFVRRPPLAIDFATKGDKLMKADLNQRVLRLMQSMDENGYSHIPVMQNGELFGVFSMGTVFLYQLRTGGMAITAKTTLADMKKYLDVRGRMENYEFVPCTETYASVRQKFEKIRGKNKRISAVFITETGHPGERLLGMLTPWDVLGDPDNDGEENT